MTVIAGSCPFVSRNLLDNHVHSGETVLYNAADSGIIDITIPNNYARLKLINATFAAAPIATLPTITTQNRPRLTFRRGEQLIYGYLHSLPTQLDALAFLSWGWDPQYWALAPVLLPGDVIRINFPIIDADATPTADVIYDLDFGILHN